MLRCDDHAVSAVVSAVLVFGLFSTAFVAWTVVSLPEWIADNEEAHQDGALTDLQSMQADLESLSAADDAGPVQTTIALEADRVPLLQQGVVPADISYVPGNWMNGSFSNPTLHLLNGQTQGMPTQAANGFSATDVQQVRGLTLALQSRLQGPGGDADITLTFTSATASVAATLLHTESPSGCDQNEMRFDVDGQPHILLCDASSTMASAYRFDAWGSNTGLRGAVAAIGTPFDITVTSTGAVSATLSAVWADEDGVLQAAGSGNPSTFGFSESGGHIVVGTKPQHHTQQDLLWDMGGIGIAQDDGQAMRQAASLSIEQIGGRNSMQWTLVDLDGTGGSISGDRATLRVQHTGTTQVLLQADAGTIRLVTPYADAWADLLNTTASAGGAGDATATPLGDEVTLQLGGSGPWWIHLRIIHATATLS